MWHDNYAEYFDIIKESHGNLEIKNGSMYPMYSNKIWRPEMRFSVIDIKTVFCNYTFKDKRVEHLGGSVN